MSRVYLNWVNLDDVPEPEEHDVNINFRFSGFQRIEWAVGSILLRAGKYLLRRCIDMSGWKTESKVKSDDER